MIRFECGTRQAYQAGCRCDRCKQAESVYKRDLRRRKREAVGESLPTPVTALSLVSGDGTMTSASGNVKSEGRVAAVTREIEALGEARPGLAAAALAMAEVLDNPKAVSTWPAAAGKLEGLLETLRKNTDSRKSKLASVRSMTSGNAKTG